MKKKKRKEETDGVGKEHHEIVLYFLFLTLAFLGENLDGCRVIGHNGMGLTYEIVLY